MKKKVEFWESKKEKVEAEIELPLYRHHDLSDRYSSHIYTRIEAEGDKLVETSLHQEIGGFIMNIAVIGNGRWAQNHIRVLKELGCFGGVYDTKHDYKDIIAYKCSGIIIATNPVNHYDIVEYAIQDNTPIYCEKPIATKHWQIEGLISMLNPDNMKRGGYIYPVFQAGFQLLYDQYPINPDAPVDKLISKRLGANPRNESIVQTLMIHDIAVAMDIFGIEHISIENAWGNRAECFVNLKWEGTTHVASLHARYARPEFVTNFRQMDFIYEDGKMSTLQNHETKDLLKLSIQDWLQAIEDVKQGKPAQNKANLEFAVKVQEIAFEIDRAIGV